MTSGLCSAADRIKWFHKARFGMFIHFGLYAVPARGEWLMFQERIPTSEYAKFAREFTMHKFDADAWAKLAVEAGMKYVVLTSRHHDGFCLYDSKVSDFSSVKTAAKRDIVAEYVKACRKAGLKVGLYYSLVDWRFPGAFEPIKYKDSLSAMIQQAHDQVRELMTNYGRIDILWYDGGGLVWHPTIKSIAKLWRAKKLNAMARKLQPNILINDRSELKEDYDTPEQKIVSSAVGRAWETCMTMGDICGWGYIRNNPNYKTTHNLLQNLVTAAEHEGNFLLNIGPKPDGTIRTKEVSRLREIGRWMKTNSEAIYGSQRCELLGGGAADEWNVRGIVWNSAGRWTRKGKIGYLHVFRWPGREIVVPLVKTKALSAVVLETGKKAKIRQEHSGRLVIYGLPKNPPDPNITVIKVRFADVPKILKEKNKAAWLKLP